MRALDDDECADKIQAAIQRLRVGSVVLYTDAQCTFSKEQRRCLQEGLGMPYKGKGVWIWDDLLTQ